MNYLCNDDVVRCLDCWTAMAECPAKTIIERTDRPCWLGCDEDFEVAE